MYMYLVNSIFSACMLVPSLIMIVINRSERPSNSGHRETWESDTEDEPETDEQR